MPGAYAVRIVIRSDDDTISRTDCVKHETGARVHIFEKSRRVHVADSGMQISVYFFFGVVASVDYQADCHRIDTEPCRKRVEISPFGLENPFFFHIFSL